MQIIMGRFNDNGDIIEEVIKVDYTRAINSANKIFGEKNITAKEPDFVKATMDRHIKCLTVLNGSQ